MTDSTSDQPRVDGGRPSAPGALALVQAFVNTKNNEAGTDALSSASTVRVWLVEHGLLDAKARVSDPEAQRTVDVREALRALLLANHGEPLAAGAVETINRVAGAAPLAVRFDRAGRSDLEPTEPGVDGAIGRLLAIVHRAMIDGTWTRLKACRDDMCRWAFYDASKNRSGAWCTMAECGNRAKVRAFRQRHRRAAARTSSGR